MKTILLTFICLLNFTLIFSQALTIETVFSTNDSTIEANELQNKARLWFYDTYNSGKSVIQLDDTENNTIISKCSFYYNTTYTMSKTSGYVKYDFTIYFKKGRYKCVLTNFNHDASQINMIDIGLITIAEDLPKKVMGYNMYNKVYKEIKQTILTDMQSLLTSLENAMNKETEAKSDDW